MVKLIVAIAKNGVIGKDNDLIWHLPADMRFFTATTKGHIVLMGRRNWDSIPLKFRPLKERLNIVVTRDTSFSDHGCEVFHTIEEAIATYKNDKRDFYVIGGGQIYDYCLNNKLIDEMYITHIDYVFEGDTFFPEIKDETWSKELILEHEIDEKNKYPFSIIKYQRI